MKDIKVRLIWSTDSLNLNCLDRTCISPKITEERKSDFISKVKFARNFISSHDEETATINISPVDFEFNSFLIKNYYVRILIKEFSIIMEATGIYTDKHIKYEISIV